MPVFFLNLAVSGVSNGAIYALIALGLVTIYRANQVVNFAQGEVLMLGAFFAYTFAVPFRLPYAVAFVLAVASSVMLGIAIERAAYRPLVRAPVITLVLVSVGISFMMKGFARITWGGKGDAIPFPSIFSFPAIQLGQLWLVPQDLIVLGGALGTMAILWAFFQRTKLGKMMRAAAENQRAAALVGIRIEGISAVTWAVGSGLGAVAGLLIAPITLLYPDMGGTLVIQAFAAAILGGFGSMPGAVVGGIAVGLSESLLGGYLGSQYISLAPFVIITAVLLIRPTGLFGEAFVVKL